MILVAWGIRVCDGPRGEWARQKAREKHLLGPQPALSRGEMRD